MSLAEHRTEFQPDRQTQPGGTASLVEILERVLDKGIVIAGDITINLLEIELLTVKLRLLVASVDKAREMGIDWWEGDPALTRRARGEAGIEERLGRLEEAVGLPPASQSGDDREAGRRSGDGDRRS
jgi:hypothetical protein